MSIVKRKAKLRVISEGTRYDVAGSIKGIGRKIEHGVFGDVRDAVVVFRAIGKNGSQEVTTFHFGTGDFAQALLLVESAKGDICR